MSNVKIEVSKLDPPTELRVYVGALIPKNKIMVSQTTPADKHKNHIKKIYFAW